MSYRDIEQAMIDEYIKRKEKWDISVVDEFPVLTELEDYIFLGHMSWSMRNARRRMIDRSWVVKPFNFEQTPGEVARDYLRVMYGESSKVHSSQYGAITAHRSPPLYATPCRFDDHAYVDLKSAYWSILKIIGWDVDYNPGRWVGAGGYPRYFPLEHNKVARSMLVSSGRSASVSVWEYNRLIEKKTRNPLLNNHLWAIVQDVLHGVALDMIETGAIYVHTDGYILPLHRVGEALNKIDEWGLIGRVKHIGGGFIYGPGRYDITGKRPLVAPAHHGQTFSYSVNPVDRFWLRPRLKRFSIGRERGVID